MAFKLPQLPYAYNALEPHIDAKTMEIHHSKHHNGYTTKLNGALEGSGMESDTIESILENLDMDNAALRNNGGGYYNHSLFWEVMGPNGGGTPMSTLRKRLIQLMDHLKSFKSAFSNAAANQFGSGWAWLCVQKGGKVEVCSLPIKTILDAGYRMWRNSYSWIDILGTRLLSKLPKQKTRLY